ncbi:hypothetical protein EfmJHP38_34270 (plasmid) [Enterococcus faecium]|nr:hypothetical protein EfmJHP38_34270 [Enterococcus faecium]
MFRLLKQYRTKGFAYFSKEDFLELLDIPKSYKQPDIDKRVIKPIRQELTAIFKGLTELELLQQIKQLEKEKKALEKNLRSKKQTTLTNMHQPKKTKIKHWL